VTGGGKGIGPGIAARFAEGGANVFIADLDLSAAERSAESLATPASRQVAMRVDVSDEGDCNAAVQRCVDEFGSIDILINDAGIFPTSSVPEMTAEFLERVLSVNLRGIARWGERRDCASTS
jgi:NAD(P)-dependent dehydrogenase (short-subunit alcohol dehydrogenase family)